MPVVWTSLVDGVEFVCSAVVDGGGGRGSSESPNYGIM